MSKKLASFTLIVAFTATIFAIWAKSPTITRQAQAIPGAPPGISLQELQLRIDTKSLPVQEIADPI